MKRETIHKLEEAVVLFLNKFDNWDLTHTGAGNLVYDAEGLTPKGRKCVIEMKFRTKYYDTKMLEVSKYENLMALPKDIVKIYLVTDPVGSYFFWLDGLENLRSVKKYCPVTTLYGAGRKTKEVYLLTEDLASYVTKNEP